MYIGKYKLVKTIGKGNFAKVKLARHMPTGQEVCVCVCSCKNYSLSIVKSDMTTYLST